MSFWVSFFFFSFLFSSYARVKPARTNTLRPTANKWDQMVLIQTHNNSKRASSSHLQFAAHSHHKTNLKKNQRRNRMKLSHPIILLLSAAIPSSGQDVSITTGFAGTNTGKLFCWRTLLSLSCAFCMMNFLLACSFFFLSIYLSFLSRS